MTASTAPIPHRILSIDPGLDAVAIAHWRVVPGRDWSQATADQKIKCLDNVTLITTKSDSPLPRRLWWIGSELQKELRFYAPDRIFLEVPARAGGYGRNSGQVAAVADGMAKMWQALGVISAACYSQMGDRDGFRTEPAPSTIRKPQRQNLVQIALTRAGDNVRYGSDKLDAIGVGLMATWDLP